MDEQNRFPEQKQEQTPQAPQTETEQTQVPAMDAPQDAAEETQEFAAAAQTAEEERRGEEEAQTDACETQPELTPQEAFAQSAAEFAEVSAPAQPEDAPQDAAAQQTPPAPPETGKKAGAREKKPWNKKIWIAGCAALLVVALVLTAVLLAAGNSPLDRVTKAFERTLSDMEGSETAGLLQGTLTGGSIEAYLPGSFVNELLGSYEQASGNAGFKLYGDLGKNSAVLQVYAPAGEEEITASVYANSDAVALELPQVLDEVYGVDLKNFKETLKTSVFAPDSGSSLALDEETYALLEGQIDGAQAKKTKEVNDHAALALKKLYKQLQKSAKKYAEIIETNETIAFMESSVKTTRVRVRIDGEAMANILRDTLTWVKEDASFKKTVTEVCELYAQALIDAYGLNAADAQDLVDQFYDAVYEGIDACGGIEQQMDGETLKLDFYMTKSANRLVQMEIEVSGAFKCVLTYGPDPSAPALIRVRYDDGWDTYDVSYSVETNDKREYAAKFSFASDGVTQGSANINWDKREDDLRIKLNDDVSEESILIKGSLRADKNEAELHIRSITFEDEIIKPELTVIVKTKDKMPAMPEYTDVLALSEQELQSLFSSLLPVGYGAGGYDFY